MKDELSLLYLILVSGSGALMILVSAVLKKRSQRKKDLFAAHAQGRVVGYLFPEDWQICTMVEFYVDGKTYTAKKEFVGYKNRQPISDRHGKIQEDERGYLPVEPKTAADLEEIARRAWPIGMTMDVYYNPKNPQENYADRYYIQAGIHDIFQFIGWLTVILGILLAYFL